MTSSGELQVAVRYVRAKSTGRDEHSQPLFRSAVCCFPKVVLFIIILKSIFLMRTDSISNYCHFSFTLQTLATLNVTEHIHFGN